jgi:hypothetical protein
VPNTNLLTIWKTFFGGQVTSYGRHHRGILVFVIDRINQETGMTLSQRFTQAVKIIGGFTALAAFAGAIGVMTGTTDIAQVGWGCAAGAAAGTTAWFGILREQCGKRGMPFISFAPA